MSTAVGGRWSVEPNRYMEEGTVGLVVEVGMACDARGGRVEFWYWMRTCLWWGSVTLYILLLCAVVWQRQFSILRQSVQGPPLVRHFSTRSTCEGWRRWWKSRSGEVIVTEQGCLAKETFLFRRAPRITSFFLFSLFLHSFTKFLHAISIQRPQIKYLHNKSRVLKVGKATHL